MAIGTMQGRGHGPISPFQNAAGENQWGDYPILPLGINKRGVNFVRRDSQTKQPHRRLFSSWQGKKAQFPITNFLPTSPQDAQFSTANPGTAVKSLSVLTTVQLPKLRAIAAIWMSICWIVRPRR